MEDETAGGRLDELFIASANDPLSHPISRRHLHDELLIRLRDCIIDGVLPPGSRIPEKALCQRFGVSRTPLREALKVLAYEGLVVLNHNRGSIVSPLSLDDLTQTFPIFATLEGLAGGIACEKLDDAGIAEIRRVHDAMIASYTRGDYATHFSANEEVHARIQLGSANPCLIQLLQRLSGRVARARRRLMPSPEQWAKGIAEHEAIMSALEARDASATSTLLRQHLETTFRMIEDAMTNPNSEASIRTPPDGTDGGNDGEPQLS
jgi:DNA-binding GntR family transcriptional regulator